MGPDHTMQHQIDLEKIIRSYAWRKYFSVKGRTKSFLVKKEKYDVDFQWNFLKFSHSTTMKEVEPEDELLNSVDFGTPNRYLRKSKRFKKMVSSPRCFYKSVSMDFDEPVELDTAYCENEQPEPQLFTISSEKTTMSKLSVEFHQNYCLGPVTNIEIALSESDFLSRSKLNLTETENQSLFVTNTKLQEFNNVSEIDLVGNFTVKPRHRTKATLVARQQTDTKDFEVKTLISLVIGCLPVVIKRKSDGKVMFTCFITSLREVFGPHQGRLFSLVKSENGQYDILLKSTGKCKFTKWIEPQLLLKTEPLDD